MYAGIDAGLKAQFEHFLTWACLSNKTSLAEVFTEAISAHRLDTDHTLIAAFVNLICNGGS